MSLVCVLRYKMFIINSPWIFRTVWAAISPFIHPITKAKIKILGGESKYMPELAKAGIPMDQVPSGIGGTYEGKLVKHLIIVANLRQLNPRVTALAVVLMRTLSRAFESNL